MRKKLEKPKAQREFICEPQTTISRFSSLPLARLHFKWNNQYEKQKRFMMFSCVSSLFYELKIMKTSSFSFCDSSFRRHRRRCYHFEYVKKADLHHSSIFYVRSKDKCGMRMMRKLQSTNSTTAWNLLIILCAVHEMKMENENQSSNIE